MQIPQCLKCTKKLCSVNNVNVFAILVGAFVELGF